MKLSEIEAVSPEDFVVFDKEDGMPYSYVIDRWYKSGAKEVDDFPEFYTADQMQEYAKECVREAVDELEGRISNVGVYSNGNEALLFQGINSAFRDIRLKWEDTKND